MKKHVLPLLLIITMVFSFLPHISMSGFADDANTTGIMRYTVLVLDTSSSSYFLDSDGNEFYTADTAIDYMKNAAKRFVERMSEADGTNYTAIVEYQGEGASIVCGFTNSLGQLNSAIDSLSEAKNTRNVAAGLQKADVLISSISEGDAIKNVVLFTTGVTNAGDYSYEGPYDETCVGSSWIRTDTEIHLYAYANCARYAAEDLKDKAYLYSIGLFQPFENMPTQGESVVSFFKMFAKDCATSASYFYDVGDPEDLEIVFGRVADDVVIDTMDTFDVYFLSHHHDNVEALYQYHSISEFIMSYFGSNGLLGNLAMNFIGTLAVLANTDYVDLEKLSINPEYYYKVALMDSILHTKITDSYWNYIAKSSLSTAQALATCASKYNLFADANGIIDMEAYLPKLVPDDELSSEGMKKLTEMTNSVITDVNNSFYSFKLSVEIVNFCIDYMREMGCTVGDFFSVISNYTVTCNAVGDVILALQYMRNTLQNPENTQELLLRGAIDQLIDSFQSSQNLQLLDFVSHTAKEQFGSVLFHTANDFVPQVLLSAEKATLIFQAWDIANLCMDSADTLSNILYPTTVSADSYSKIFANYVIEETIKDAILSLSQESYCEDARKAATMVQLYDLLADTYDYGIQVSGVLFEQAYQDGVLNGLRRLFSRKGTDRYTFMMDCLKSYRAELNSITEVKEAAKADYKIYTGAYQPYMIVAQTNGQVLMYQESTIQTGGTIPLPEELIDLDRLESFLNVRIEVSPYYRDIELTQPYNSNDPVVTPLALFCNIRLYPMNGKNEMILMNGETNITATSPEFTDSYVLKVREEDEGDGYQNLSGLLEEKSDFSLFDITLKRGNAVVQPEQAVTVGIPILETDFNHEGKVYRLEKNGILTAMNSWIEEGRYCFETTHFSEYAVIIGDLTAILLPCNGGSTCPGKVFTDMPAKKNWAHDPIDWAIVNKVTAGTSESTFSPNDICTRGQIVTFLWRAAGSPEPETTNNPFTDVKSKKFYYKAVLWAAESGITSGTSGTTFSPDDRCTRGQIVTFLWRFAGSPKPKTTSNPFTDVKSGKYYSKAVLWAAENSITSGTSKTTFSPDDACTRAQVVTFLYRNAKVPKESPHDDCKDGHLWGDWETTVFASCTTSGKETRTCSRCGMSESRSMDSLGHDYAYMVKNAPTLMASGSLKGICSRCSATSEIALPPLNTSNYNYSVILPASCTTTGTGRYTWKITSYGSFYFDVTLSLIAHCYDDSVASPTCTEQGYTTHTCSVCGSSYKDNFVSALGHVYVNGICTRCGAVDPDYEEIISGDCGDQGDNVLWELQTGSGLLTIRGSGAMKDYPFMSYVPWSSYRSQIKTVVIQQGVTSIGNEAFHGCNSLLHVQFSSDVSRIGGFAFADCSSLGDITLPSGIECIDEHAFDGTGYYNNPNNWYANVLYLGKWVLTSKADIDSAEIRQGTLGIANGAFSFCSSMTRIAIPEGVKIIGKWAFSYCSSLGSITIPASVTQMGEHVFSNCTALTDIIVVSGNDAFCSVDGVLFDKGKTTLIRFPAGRSCSKYVIPSSVTEIGVGAFFWCSDLSGISIPASVETINENAFFHCTKLTNVIIPASVVKIEERAFFFCSGLKDIWVMNPSCLIFDDRYTMGDADVATIHGYSDSSASTYAATYGYAFSEIR